MYDASHTCNLHVGSTAHAKKTQQQQQVALSTGGKVLVDGSAAEATAMRSKKGVGAAAKWPSSNVVDSGDGEGGGYDSDGQPKAVWRKKGLKKGDAAGGALGSSACAVVCQHALLSISMRCCSSACTVVLQHALLSVAFAAGHSVCLAHGSSLLESPYVCQPLITGMAARTGIAVRTA